MSIYQSFQSYNRQVSWQEKPSISRLTYWWLIFTQATFVWSWQTIGVCVCCHLGWPHIQFFLGQCHISDWFWKRKKKIFFSSLTFPLYFFAVSFTHNGKSWITCHIMQNQRSPKMNLGGFQIASQSYSFIATSHAWRAMITNASTPCLVLRENKWKTNKCRVFSFGFTWHTSMNQG